MPRLFTHNVQVDKWNAFQLSELPGEESVLEAEQTGPEHQREFLTRNLLTPATLRLKPGALVMFTVNRNGSGAHHESGWRDPAFVNGQMGVVEKVESKKQKAGTESDTSPYPLPDRGGEGDCVWVRTNGEVGIKNLSQSRA